MRFAVCCYMCRGFPCYKPASRDSIKVAGDVRRRLCGCIQLLIAKHTKKHKTDTKFMFGVESYEARIELASFLLYMQLFEVLVILLRGWIFNRFCKTLFMMLGGWVRVQFKVVYIKEQTSWNNIWFDTYKTLKGGLVFADT